MRDINQYDRSRALVYAKPEEQVQNDLYSSVITEVSVKLDEFVNMGMGQYYPGKSLTNQIGSAAGIEFLPSVKIEEIKDTYYHPMHQRDMEMTCGIRCTKMGRKMKPDGTWEKSSPCTYEFNFKDRCELDKLADMEKNGSKYNTPVKEWKHFLELKKFATQRASTGAELMVIRELTGIPTGFKKDDIDKGIMVFSQVCKSKALQGAEAQAVIENIRAGGQIAGHVNDASRLLTGKDAFEDDGGAEMTGNTDGQSVEDVPDYTPPSQSAGVPDLETQLEEWLQKVDDAGFKNYIWQTFNDNGKNQDVFNWCVGQIKEKYGE